MHSFPDDPQSSSAYPISTIDDVVAMHKRSHNNNKIRTPKVEVVGVSAIVPLLLRLLYNISKFFTSKHGISDSRKGVKSPE
jgi:hypothetical protein